MEPETELERADREGKLKVACEALGLIVHGSIVVAPLARPVAVDASMVDLGKLVASLMYLAQKAGEKYGRKQMKEEMLHLLGDKSN